MLMELSVDVHVVRRGENALFIDALDVQNLLKHLHVASTLAHPCFTWTAMRTLWVATTSLEMRLFILDVDIEYLLHAIGVNTVRRQTSAPSTETVIISVNIDGQTYVLGACPIFWFVRDVIITLRCQHSSVANIISIYDSQGWEVQTTDTGVTLDMNTTLKKAASTKWCVVHRFSNLQKNKNSLVLRGFPYSFSARDIWSFLAHNHVIKNVLDIHLVRGKKFKHDKELKFLGLVYVALSPSTDLNFFKMNIHNALADERYIEVLERGFFSIGRNHRDSKSLLTTSIRQRTLTLQRLDMLVMHQ